MPFRGQKDDDGRKKLGRTLSQFLGRSRSRAPSPLQASGAASPPVPSPAIPPSVKPPAPTPVPTTIQTAAAQIFHDLRSVSSAQLYGKLDDNTLKSPLPSTRIETTHVARSPSITVKPPVQPTSPPPTISISRGEPHRQTGNAAVASGRFDEAVAEYTKALQIDPNNALCLSDRSYAYLMLSRFHDARSDAERAVKVDPNSSIGWSRLGHANMRLASYTGAKTAFEKALQLQGNGREAEATRRDLADAARSLDVQQGRPIPATAPSRPASSNPASPPSRPTATIPTNSRSYSTSNRTGPSSLPRATPSGSRSPTSSTTSTSIPPTPSTTSEATLAAERHRILGNKAVSSGDFEKAVDEYSRAIQLHPSNAVYLANRSYAYFALSRYHAALIDAEQSVAADPTYWKGWSRLGAARKAVGEYSDAKTAYNEALRAQGGGLGAEATRRDLADVTRLLEQRTDRAGTSTSRSATDVPSAASTPSPAANSSSLRPATFVLRPQTSASISSRPTSSTPPPTSSSSAAHPATLPGSQTSSQSGSITSQAVPPSPRRPTPVPRGPSASITPQAVAAPPLMPTSSASGSSAHPPTSAAVSPEPNASSESTSKAEHHKALGNEAVACRNFEKAVKEYTLAIQLDPSSAVYLANRSYVYLNLSRYHDARIDAEKSIAADPAYWKGWSRLGSAHKALEEYSEAKTAFEKALRVLGVGSGADVTRRDLAEVTRLLDERNNRPSTSAAGTAAVLSPTVATTAAADIPSPRTATLVPSHPTASSPAAPRPASSTPAPPHSAPSSRTLRSTPYHPTVPARSVPIPAPQAFAPHSAAISQPPAITTSPVDPPPAYRPGELSSPDPVVAAVAGQELDRELDELERKIATRNAGALSIGSLTLNGLVSFFVSLVGRETQYTWDEDLDLVKIAHPAFALYYADEFKGSTLHQVDAELHRKFAGLVPGTVSITGYSELIAEHMRATTPRTVTTLSSTGTLPSVSAKQLLGRIDRLRIGLDFTDQEASIALRQFLGPDRTTWINPTERFKLSNQIMDICMALNRRDIFEDFRDTSSVALLAVAAPPAGMGIWNFVYQIVLGYELHLRLEKEGGWYSGVSDKVSANILISKQWINNVDMFTEGDDSNVKMRSRVQARQIEGLLRFAEIMKWPYLSEMRDYVENAYVDLLGGKTVKVDVWDWLFGIMLPGRFFSFKIMSVLVTATPSLSSHGTTPHVNSGFNLEGRSWWRCRTVLGAVLAGARGVKSVCGWIGPCPGIADPPAKPWIRIRARPVEFLRGADADPLGDIDDASDDGSGEEDYGTSRRLFSPRAGETVFDFIQDLSDMSLWNEPVPPSRVNQSCSISKIVLKALPLETTGSIDRNDARTEHQASITFQFTGITGTSDVTYTLYTNPTFISAHPCVGTHVVHRREISRFKDNVVTVKDLKAYEGGGGRKVLVINAQCDGGEAVARAWCAERGKHAVVRRGKGTCFTCSVSMAGPEGLGVGVLIWS